MKFIKKNWHLIALGIIMAVAFALNFYNLGQDGYGNQYYSATVKSMLTSWKNFFFASFDGAGYVTVDKPALGLWLQAAFAFVFGVHGWSLVLPEALCALGSIAVVYHLAARSFGRISGLISAAVMASTPIFIAVSRTNNLDSSLVFVCILATWAALVAAEKGDIKHLALSMVLIGLGFNIKMLQAFMILPAIYLMYFFTAKMGYLKRIRALAIGTVILALVSLSWPLAVDLTPAESRPYIGSSQTNSVIELAFGYNGIQRLLGMNGGMNSKMDGERPAGMPNGQIPNGQFPAGIPNGQMPAGGMNGQAPGSNGMPEAPGGKNMQGGIGGAGENGEKGILRIFDQQLAGQISWFLVFALFGALILTIPFIRRKRTKLKINGIDINNISENKDTDSDFEIGETDTLEIMESKAMEEKNKLRHLLLWVGWLLPMLVFFSVAGFYHRYYLSMLAPAIACLTGIGAVEMWKAYRKNNWRWIWLPISMIATGMLQGMILWRYPTWRGYFLPFAIGIPVFAGIMLIAIKALRKSSLKEKTMKTIVIIGMASLFVAPLAWAATPLMYGSSTTLPYAGPDLQNGEGGFSMGGKSIVGMGENSGNAALIKFLLEKRQGEKFILAVADANSAAPIILETGEPVMALGGFSGSDNIMTVARLEKMVKAGELRYIQIGGRGMGQNSEVTAWVQEHGTAVEIPGYNSSEVINSAEQNKTLGVINSEEQNNSPGVINSAEQNKTLGRMSNGTVYDLAPEKN